MLLKVATSLGLHSRTTGSHLKGSNAMKKACTAFLAAVVSYSLLGILAYGIYTGSSSLVGVTVAAYWMIIFLSIGVGLLVLVLSYAVKADAAGEFTPKAIELIGSAAKKRNPVLRAISWVELIVIVILLAFSSWIFTAICYALTVITVKIFFLIARDNVANLPQPEVM